MKLILIRGLPGSGKSTFAKCLQMMMCTVAYEEGDRTYCSHFEADQFFVDDHGQYQFNAKNVIKAHGWCKGATAIHLTRGTNVIVSNTFTRLWEMQPYIDMAKKYGAELTVLTCEGNYGNVHDVPEEVIEKMRKRWEPYRG